ncbi:MAG: hypothetical protein M3256_19365 [Actinomycetota bacterium]|nr:hypothetical protein [Actinomycetota bacterium]
MLDLSQGDVRAAADFSRHADIRSLTLHDDNRHSLGGRMAGLLAAALNGTVQDGSREKGAAARTVPDPLDQLDLKVGLLIEEWHLQKEPSQADVEDFTAEDARQNLRNDIRYCRFLLDELEGLLPAVIEEEGGLDPGSEEQDSEASPGSASDEAVMGNPEDPEDLSLASFLTPSDLLQQGEITRSEYQIFLRVMALSNPSGPLDEPQASSEWPQTVTKAQSDRRDLVRRMLEKQLRSAQLTRMGQPRFNITVLPESAPTRTAPEVPLSVVPTKGETIEHLFRRGVREYQLWVDRLEAADLPPGVHRQAELPRFLDWYLMYLANLSVNQIAARSEAPEGRPYDRKTVAHGIDVIAKMMGQKRVRGSERFVLLDDEPTTD